MEGWKNGGKEARKDQRGDRSKGQGIKGRKEGRVRRWEK